MSDVLSTDEVFGALQELRAKAAVAGLAMFGAAGAAAARNCRGPGHLPAEICDALYRMGPDTLVRFAKLSKG